VIALLLLLLLALGAPAAAEVPSPASVLGFEPGEDRVLADWHQIAGYFRRLDAASPRVSVEEVGKTTEGLPFLVAVISSEANMARLEAIRQDNLRLFDPRTLPPEEAERVIARGKVVVALHHGIHSTEVGAPHTAMLTAYELAAGDDPAVRSLLEEVVVVLLPSHNPDGTQKVTEWYRRVLGTPYEGSGCGDEAGCRLPFLYQKYVGHDNNRDWYMFSQEESRLTVAHVYDRWRPQVVHDLHQMGARGARLFVPPYLDPWEPNVDSALIAAVNGLGAHIAARLTGEGKGGVVTGALFDAWAPARAYPHTHGGVRVLSESASARMATPLEVPFGDLRREEGFDPRLRSARLPLPWSGGTWRLRDVIAYQRSATRALLEHAAGNRAYWLRTAYDVSRRAAQRTQPFAFVFPAAPADPHAAASLLRVLRTGGVEVHRARKPFEAAGRRFPAGSHVVLMAQPFSSFAKTVLERQRYPTLRPFAGGPVQRPYDVTAHTLPLLMGVETVTVDAPFEAALEPVAVVSVPPGTVERGRGRYLALGHRTGDLVALGRLQRAGVPMRWLLAEHVEGRRRYPAGTLLAPFSARRQVEPLARDLGLQVGLLRGEPRTLLLKPPRVGLYQSWLASMDEGWTRFLFEKQMEVPYTTLHDADVRAGRLRDRFDAIVLPDQRAEQILTGHPAGSLPPEYTGGLGREGARALKAFVEEGGTLVALDSASDFAIEELALPVSNVLAQGEGRADGTDEVDCPGSLLQARFDPESPLSHGLPESVPVWFEASPAFSLRGGRSVAWYPEADLLLSGWLSGGAALHGKTALAEVPLGKGRVVLFGFRPQYRGQSWSTYIPFLNALYTSAAAPPVP
jgi:hypothetical protein